MNNTEVIETLKVTGEIMVLVNDRNLDKVKNLDINLVDIWNKFRCFKSDNYRNYHKGDVVIMIAGLSNDNAKRHNQNINDIIDKTIRAYKVKQKYRIAGEDTTHVSTMLGMTVDYRLFGDIVAHKIINMDYKRNKISGREDEFKPVESNGKLMIYNKLMNKTFDLVMVKNGKEIGLNFDNTDKEIETLLKLDYDLVIGHGLDRLYKTGIKTHKFNSNKELIDLLNILGLLELNSIHDSNNMENLCKIYKSNVNVVDILKNRNKDINENIEEAIRLIKTYEDI